MANVLIELERFDEAIALLNKALTVYRRVSAYSSEGDALRGLSHASRSIAEVAKANEFINGALSIAQEHRNSAWEGFWLLECGQVKLSQDDPAGALVAYRRAAVLQRQLGDRIREAVVFDATGEAYQRLGRYDEAVEFHRFAVSAFRELNEKWHLAIALERLAVALANGEESAAAETHLREALALFATFGDAGSARHRTRIETALARASRVDHQSCRIAHTAIRPASSLAVSAGSVRLMSSDAMSVSSATGSTIR
jgi:tetratricopeptide (TPR) repeat protein